LAEAGARVIAVARRIGPLEELRKKFSNIEIVPQDVRAPLNNLEAALKNRKVDILINNAGLALGRDPIGQIKDDDYVTMIDTNIRALISVTQLVLPRMIEAADGDIVNLGSIAAYHTYGGGAVYAATKYAARAMTDAFRQDLIGKGIRVMGIHPGMVETEFSIVRLKGDRDGAKKIYAGMTPLSAEDIAESILWTLTRPRHVNIQSLVIMPTDQASIRDIDRH
jgi:NADP-dependent 3-hydroxy acid dehydrogenase YdfG